ncbi:thioesterase [Streptomyces sp. RPA4-5]|uniref:thioesterase II family protein n=1 Tax=Streptomyces TaxID=1883 RepID=UPI00143E930E|nr:MULTISPECIES: alpha/beta fold hydrolase [Streptomyces]MCX4639690.1 alpha/beta fold hydrolase [Streptomyces platensis]QIY56835.1 thioesterase [Streptomyces sp. RPA4-5]WJY39787.1 alpha/beta fold hydrolase [Streptomyces sp. P9-2B-2]
MTVSRAARGPHRALDQEWFRRPRPVPDPRMRLVCFPHAGGAASFFRDWPQWLPADIEVVAVCYPGREDRIAVPPVESMDALADRIAGELVPALDRPLAFFGHSMGASVAHEVALRIERRHGRVLSRLLVSSRSAPSRLRPSGISRESDEVLVADVMALGGTFSAALDHPDLRELLLPAIRADYRLIDDYRPPAPLPRLGVPVTALLGDRDPHVHEADMRAWAEVTEGDFGLRVRPGDHFYLLEQAPSLVAEVGRLLTSR